MKTNTRYIENNQYVIERKDFYDLVQPSSHTIKENKIEITLVYISMEGFHDCHSENYVVENNFCQNRVIELFFFCNQEKIHIM